MSGAILVVEDNETDARNIEQCLCSDGFRVRVVSTAAAAFMELAARPVDCVLLDKHLPDMDGIECLRAIRLRYPQLPVIIITAYGSEEVVTAALRLRAADYLKKEGVWVHGIASRVREGLRRWELGGSNATEMPTAAPLSPPAAPAPLIATLREQYAQCIGVSDALETALDLAHRAAERDLRVLLVGETGTGKEIFAKAIHANGRRRAYAFIAVNCGAVSDSMLEDELFGHVRGAYTDAVSEHHGIFLDADKGTLFLDEIESASLRLQTALLRVLEDGVVRPIGGGRANTKRVDVRIISASKCDLRAEAEAGRFRSDLFYRLSVSTIRLPPLRERIGDVEVLLRHFLRSYSERSAVPEPQLTGAAMQRLIRYPWPGNVRELEHCVEALVAGFDPGSPIAAEQLDALLTASESPKPDARSKPGISAEQLKQSLHRHGGIVKHVADEYGVAPRTIRRRLDSFGIDWKHFRKRR